MQAVTLQSVTKIFGHRPALFNWMGEERSGETRALDAISLSVRGGEILVLLGPNGSGKTNILQAVMLLSKIAQVHRFRTSRGRDAITVSPRIKATFEERGARMRRMRAVVKEHNVYRWAANLITELAEIRLDKLELVRER